MDTVKLLSLGDETFVAIPPEMLAELGLGAGGSIAMHVARGALVIEHPDRMRPRYKLEDLLAQCELSQPMSDVERELMDAPPVGNERIP